MHAFLFGTFLSHVHHTNIAVFIYFVKCNNVQQKSVVNLTKCTRNSKTITNFKQSCDALYIGTLTVFLVEHQSNFYINLLSHKSLIFCKFAHLFMTF